jgi:ATP-dependent protease ClpP protease subunit
MDDIQLYGLDLKNNEIYLTELDRGYQINDHNVGNGVDYFMVNQFIKNINICRVKNPLKPLVIHMKTSGGDWNEGMAIYDAIKSHPTHVTILNYTHARSMSSLIFSAADNRIMMPHSYFMFHLGTYAIEGEYQTAISNVEFDKMNEDVMIRIYAELMNEKGKYAGKGVDGIMKWIRKQMAYKGDVFFNAKQAVELGLADGIFTSWDKLKEI